MKKLIIIISILCIGIFSYAQLPSPTPHQTLNNGEQMGVFRGKLNTNGVNTVNYLTLVKDTINDFSDRIKLLELGGSSSNLTLDTLKFNWYSHITWDNSPAIRINSDLKLNEDLIFGYNSTDPMLEGSGFGFNLRNTGYAANEFLSFQIVEDGHSRIQGNNHFINFRTDYIEIDPTVGYSLKWDGSHLTEYGIVYADTFVTKSDLTTYLPTSTIIGTNSKFEMIDSTLTIQTSANDTSIYIVNDILANTAIQVDLLGSSKAISINASGNGIGVDINLETAGGSGLIVSRSDIPTIELADSLWLHYLDLMNLPAGSVWYTNSPTGAVDSANTEPAYIGWEMDDLPTLEEYEKDVKMINGHMERRVWYIDYETKELKSQYGWDGLGMMNTQSAYMIYHEITVRWMFEQNKKIAELQRVQIPADVTNILLELNRLKFVVFALLGLFILLIAFSIIINRK